ncbi:PEGA domain-containing protein [Persicimonas caeni]|nr:PEGA domain-containing protein [Persicimonas caeni]
MLKKLYLSLLTVIFTCACAGASGTKAPSEGSSADAAQEAAPGSVLPEHHRTQLRELSSAVADCQNDDVHACTELARRYAAGHEVPPSAEATETFAARACELGDDEHCAYLAVELVQHDHTAALGAGHIAKLCAAGYKPSCRAQARLMVSGRGLSKAPARAAKMMRPPCESGESDACWVLVDAVQAADVADKPWALDEYTALLDRVCQKGMEDACKQLGDFYFEGVTWGDATIEADVPRAKSYYQKAGQSPPSSAQVTVYSKPAGLIVIDGQVTTQRTPATVDISPGEHALRVKFDNGETSEPKSVTGRRGERVKLFFRYQ